MSRCNCPACYERRGWESRVGDVVIPAPRPPEPSESLIDSLVGHVVGSLAMLREPCYGGVAITDDQIKERARAIVQRLILEVAIGPLS